MCVQDRFNPGCHCLRQTVNHRSDRLEPYKCQSESDQAGREIVDQHFKTGLDFVLKHRIKFLDRETAQRSHDHGAHDHRDFRPYNHAHCGDGADNRTTFACNHFTSRVTDQQRNEIRKHRADHRSEGLIRQVTIRDE